MFFIVSSNRYASYFEPVLNQEITFIVIYRLIALRDFGFLGLLCVWFLLMVGGALFKHDHVYNCDFVNWLYLYNSNIFFVCLVNVIFGIVHCVLIHTYLYREYWVLGNKRNFCLDRSLQLWSRQEVVKLFWNAFSDLLLYLYITQYNYLHINFTDISNSRCKNISLKKSQSYRCTDKG